MCVICTRHVHIIYSIYDFIVVCVGDWDNRTLRFLTYLAEIKPPIVLWKPCMSYYVVESLRLLLLGPVHVLCLPRIDSTNKPIAGNNHMYVMHV